MVMWNLAPPPCPKCGKEEMIHRVFSLIPNTGTFKRKNGWYCKSCGAGAYQLGTKQDAERNTNTEAEAARFAIKLLNKK